MWYIHVAVPIDPKTKTFAQDGDCSIARVGGTAACMMGFAKNLKDATDNSPAVPKVGFFTVSKDYTDIGGLVKGNEIELPSVAVQRTARRIMDGTVYVRE